MGTKKVFGLAALLLASVGLILGGCGSSDSSSGTRSIQEQRAKQVAQRAQKRAHLRHQARVAAKRAAARRRIRAAHRVALRQQRVEEREARQRAAAEAREREEAETSEPTGECDPNYTGACLNPYSSDYDCEGGSGNGPDYTGEVRVVGEDHYGLDADGDGVGCRALLSDRAGPASCRNRRGPRCRALRPRGRAPSGAVRRGG
jgi:hypothetical protein